MTRLRWTAMCAVLLVLTACASTSPGLPSQYSAEPAPVALPAGVDERSPQAICQYGTTIIERNPGEAARAFLWASALDPTWAAPIFARRLALLMSDVRFFNRYQSNAGSVAKDPRSVYLDSLYLGALQINPFIDRSLEATALRFQIAENYRDRVGRENPTMQLDEGTLGYAIDNYLQSAPVETRAWIAHAEGRYWVAAELYENALRGKRERAAVATRVELARVLFRLGNYQEAGRHLERVLVTLRSEDSDRLVRVYRSKALMEYTLGLVRESLGFMDRARDHYAAALQEDLSYYPAHLRMADLAMQAGDTATAAAAYRLAIDIAPGNAVVLMTAGASLGALGDRATHERLLGTVIETHPAFAAPHLALARVLDDHGDAAGALASYNRFLELSGRDSPDRAHAEARTAALAAAVRAGSGS